MTTLQAVDADLQEVHRLVNLTKSALVRDRLHGLLSELLQARSRNGRQCSVASATLSGAVRVVPASCSGTISHAAATGRYFCSSGS